MLRQEAQLIAIFIDVLIAVLGMRASSPQAVAKDALPPTANSAAEGTDERRLNAHPAATNTIEQSNLSGPLHLDHPTVLTTSELQANGKSFKLFGIEGLAGTSARGLQSLLANSSVDCRTKNGNEYICLLPDRTDLAEIVLINGAAKTTKDAPASYRAQEEAAQAARRGIWVNLPPPPVTIKHPDMKDTATIVVDGLIYKLDAVSGYGRPYSEQLQQYIRSNGDALVCSPMGREAPEAQGHYMCLLDDGTDIAKVALVNGVAKITTDAPDSYRVQQLDALNNGRGLWAAISDGTKTIPPVMAGAFVRPIPSPAMLDTPTISSSPSKP
jgi:endonuclease YncB( thermonuclease family)